MICRRITNGNFILDQQNGFALTLLQHGVGRSALETDMVAQGSR